MSFTRRLCEANVLTRIPRKVPLLKEGIVQKNLELPNNTSTDLKKDGGTFCGLMRVKLLFLGSTGHSLRDDPPNSEFKLQSIVKTSETRWCKHRGMGMLLGLFTADDTPPNTLVNEQILVPRQQNQCYGVARPVPGNLNPIQNLWGGIKKCCF